MVILGNQGEPPAGRSVRILSSRANRRYLEARIRLFEGDSEEVVIIESCEGTQHVLKQPASDEQLYSQMALHLVMLACFPDEIVSCTPVWCTIDSYPPRAAMLLNHEPANLDCFLQGFSRASLTPDFYLELFRQASLAVACFHAAGLLVLDLKPQNLLAQGWKISRDASGILAGLRIAGATHVGSSGDDDFFLNQIAANATKSMHGVKLAPLPTPHLPIRIADFGSVRASNTDRARRSGATLVGMAEYDRTLRYDAPNENGMTAAADFQTDVYKLGLLFAKLLVDPHEIEHKLPSECLTFLLEMEDLPIELQPIREVIQKCTVGEFRNALEVLAQLSSDGGCLPAIREEQLALCVGRILDFGHPALVTESIAIARYISQSDQFALLQKLVVMLEGARIASPGESAWARGLGNAGVKWELDRLKNQLSDGCAESISNATCCLTDANRTVRFLDWYGRWDRNLKGEAPPDLSPIQWTPWYLLMHPIPVALIFDAFPPWNDAKELAVMQVNTLRESLGVAPSDSEALSLVVLCILAGDRVEAARWWNQCQRVLDPTKNENLKREFEEWSRPSKKPIWLSRMFERMVTSAWRAVSRMDVLNDRSRFIGAHALRAAQERSDITNIDLRESMGQFGPLFWGSRHLEMELIRSIASAVPPSVAWFYEDFLVDAAWFYEAALFP